MSENEEKQKKPRRKDDAPLGARCVESGTAARILASQEPQHDPVLLVLQR
jgi:hypothetical protein